MASIVKRKSKYSVVYDYTDENGKRRQGLDCQKKPSPGSGDKRL